MGIQNKAHGGKKHVGRDARGPAGRLLTKRAVFSTEDAGAKLLSTNRAESSTNWAPYRNSGGWISGKSLPFPEPQAGHRMLLGDPGPAESGDVR
jgi:hypothetical protein